MSDSTPRPWRVSSKAVDGYAWDWGVILGADNRPVASAGLGARFTEQEAVEARRKGDVPPTVAANAALIVEAVNSLAAHKACVEALRTIAYGSVPRKAETRHREDGQPSRFDRCEHGVIHDDDCGSCISNFAAAALEALEKGEAR